jgi:hypothetical protein
VLAAGNLQRASFMLGQLPSDFELPELSSWAEDLKRRLEDLRSKPLLMATGARRVGAIMSLPKALHEEDNPILFWRGTQLCVRQEASKPPRMRCAEAKTGRWGKEEPYRSPYGKGRRVVIEEEMGGWGYQTTVSISTPEKVYDLGAWPSPVVVARSTSGRAVVVSSEDPRQHEGLEDFDFASGAVSLIAGGGQYYFSQPDELRSLTVEGLTWKFVVPVSGSEVHCAAPPRVSPDGQWAACPAKQAGAAARPGARAPAHYDLLLLGLTPRTP